MHIIYQQYGMQATLRSLNGKDACALGLLFFCGALQVWRLGDELHLGKTWAGRYLFKTQ